MNKLIVILSFCLAALSAVADDAALYREKYRPQYHFTPKSRWIGDPCGTVKYNGRYLAYSWGGAYSDDLVHWTEFSDHSIKGLPDGIATFTGSVVADRENTAGYGPDALIAAFTSFDERTKKQSQSIAFSRDGGMTYQYYDLNPVVDIWSTEFRDPTVIRDHENGRWIMLVAKALEKKVAFYGSTDLKHWEWLSDFGPMGDNERSWECPDMFRVPVEGTDCKKWVLLVSVNWAREQYFVGDFDGTRFIPDHPYAEPLYVDEGLDYYASRVFQNFDDPDSDEVHTIGWVNTWDYAQTAPSEWGKGIWSLPRRLTLCQTPDGLRLRQSLVEAVGALVRSESVSRLRLKPGVTRLDDVSRMGNVYELKVSLEADKPDVTGLNLCVGEGRKVTVSYDTESHYLTVDRTNSTDAVIPKFDRIACARIPVAGNTLDLDIFVDKSTIEIFAEGGRKVFTLLTYAPEGADGAEIFSLHGNTKAGLTARPLDSIW